jgi:hypothetical protein
VKRLLKRYWWGFVPVVLVALAAAWYLISPLFIDRVVDEPFPGGLTPTRVHAAGPSPALVAGTWPTNSGTRAGLSA